MATKRAVLFLHGRYSAEDISAYRKLCKDAFCIAVDGGYSFFRKTTLTPDLLIGDFDSLGKLPKDLPKATRVIEAEVRKDQTDSEMAVRYCLDREFHEVDIVQPGFGEMDHFLGNIMLLRLAGSVRSNSGRAPKIRVLDRHGVIDYLKDRSLTIAGAKGQAVSLLPLSRRVKYTCTGTDYLVRNASLKPGETRGLRNRITAGRARFSVTGEALLVRLFAPR